VPDTKETREKKGRVKEQQLLEADIEAAKAAAATETALETPSEGEDGEELDLTFET